MNQNELQSDMETGANQEIELDSEEFEIIHEDSSSEVQVEGTLEELDTYTEEELWYKLQYQTVLIQGDNIFGSGSIYKIDQEHVYIVSNDHLTIYAMNPQIYFYDGTKASAVNTENSEQLDMGILEVDVKDLNQDTLKQLTMISLDDSIETLIDMKVYSLGSAEGNGQSKVIGTVLALDEYHAEFHSFMTRCSGEVQAGMSGAGVFDLYGNYLGMLSGEKDGEFVFLPVDIMKEEIFFGGK